MNDYRQNRRDQKPLEARRAHSPRRRQGMAVFIVFLMLALVLGLSYAAVRSQHMAVLIERNAERTGSARQAAVTGISMALRKMHTSAWEGVGSTLTGSLDAYQSYRVTFTAGDPSLVSGRPDYADLPYRVTLASTGYAADPDHPQSVATHSVRAVVRLAPRKLADEPSDWAEMQKYTVYQTTRDPFELDLPCRLKGPIRAQGKLKIGAHYPNYTDAWWRYLKDLDRMRLAGRPDYRPFNGPVYLPYVEQDADQLLALRDSLSVTAVDLSVKAAAADWVKPDSLTTYRIYPKGPEYVVPALPYTVQGASLGPDPASNPLGIYYCPGTLTVGDNVTIRGSVYCKNDLRISGVNVRLESVDLPAIQGAPAPVRLPVVVCQNMQVQSTASLTVAGLVAAFDRFEILKSPETVTFGLVGRLIARKVYYAERQPWETTNWKDYYLLYIMQLGNPLLPTDPHFPMWMAQWGRQPKPLLTAAPDSTEITYHWGKTGGFVYVAHPDDPGLRWDLLEWTDNP